MDTPEPVRRGGLDLVGFGKVAEAIPRAVYKQSTATVCKTFESLVAPITQSTDGVGRLIRQTFDNWVEARKALGTYTLQQALIRAQARAEKQGIRLQPPSHPKTFLSALEESSLETDSVVHEMWVNLLASQLADQNSHPRFVGILAQLGPADAKLLSSLHSRPDDPRLDSYVGGSQAHFGMKTSWMVSLDEPSQPWNLSVTVICQQSLAEISPMQIKINNDFAGLREEGLLHLTPFGEAFLAAVAP